MDTEGINISALNICVCVLCALKCGKMTTVLVLFNLVMIQTVQFLFSQSQVTILHK